MKRFRRNALIFVCLILICATCVGAVTTLIPGGQVIGLQLSDDTVTVVKVENPATGLKPGDRLLSLDGKPIHSAQDLKNALSATPQQLTICRQGKNQTLTVQGPTLGVYLRQGTAGIGTVTFYNPENGSFGALGHGVCDAEGKLTEMNTGTVYAANVLSVKPGKIGKPGQLAGSLTGSAPLGVLEKNTRQGVFGKMEPVLSEALPVAKKSQIQPGTASIYATVSGSTLQEYSVEILKIYPQGNDTRNMLLKITDPELLSATNGIVQGMSGSPIIQDGKLIGAVTHVLVNDPTTGYGIFIENMLDAAA